MAAVELLGTITNELRSCAATGSTGPALMRIGLATSQSVRTSDSLDSWIVCCVDR